MENRVPLIKVCGMREPENIRALSSLPINFMGTIFYPKSPRFSADTPETAAAFRALPKSISSVGVFVKSSLEDLLRHQKEYDLNYLQLHSDEDVNYCEKARSIAPLIKAVGIQKKEDFVSIDQYSSLVDYFIFDTATKAYGGSGKKFDWHILESYTGETPFLLAGGIGPDDVQALQAINHPQCVGFDLNSGFETAPALKDIDAISTFINALA